MTDAPNPSAPGLSLVDPATNPHLSGRFAPVHREITAEVSAVEGEVPDDLVGAYLRNGPNPKFPPLGSYTYPMEGDGMLHGLWFEPGGVRYRNRWVTTNGLAAEERAGRALYGGLLTPAMVDPSRLGPDPDPGWPTKLDAFINVVSHAGHLLALEEGLPAYEVTPQLETMARFDFDGGLPKGLCAHPKVDRRTGELVVFRYDVEEPFLTWAVVAADGTMAQPERAVNGVEHSCMIHDFVITEHHLVLVVSPAVFDVAALMAGGPLLSWQPGLGTRMAVIRRDGTGSTRWIETDAFWVWHFANAHEDGNHIELSFPRWTLPGFLVPDAEDHGDYVRARLSPDAGTVSFDTLHAGPSEFPRIDDRRIGRPNRFAIVTAATGQVQGLVPGEHDALCRVDLESGQWTEHRTGGAVGETIFAPRGGGSDDELDGYYLAYVNAVDQDSTSLWIWDAAEFPGPPRAKLHLPQRVPNGLHGNWFPAS